MIPPHDLDAEAIALSAILYAATDADLVLEMLTPEVFYSDANAAVFEAARDVRASGARPNAATVVAWLRARGKLENCGGAAYVKSLELSVPYSATVRDQCGALRDLHAVRRLITTCQVIAAEGFGDVGDIRKWIDESEARVRAVAAGAAEDSSAESAKVTLARVYDAIQAGEVPGVDTGLLDLDALLGSLRAGQMVTIGAHSGIGKSALSTGIAVHVATKYRHQSVLVFSLEMTKDELVQRMLFGAARVDSSKLWGGRHLNDDDWASLTAAAETVGLENLVTDDKPGLTIQQLTARARRKAVELQRAGIPLGLVVVDYAQLIGGANNKNRNREQEVAEVSRGLKQLAKELALPVVVLAQLNEDSRKDKRRPAGRDLRESRALHHDSDKVVLIYNEHADKRAEVRRNGDVPAKANPSGEIVELIVDKNRGGPTGRVDALFFAAYTLFANLGDGHDYHR